MPDLTSFWISFRVALISSMIVTIFGILISKWLYNKKRYWVNLLEDSKMLNTARTMGASETKIFFKLVLPLSKRSILAGIMMSFARAIGEFGATLMVAGYIPDKTNTLPLEIYFLVEQGKENEAWLWVLVLVAFAVTVIATINLVNRDTFREVD